MMAELSHMFLPAQDIVLQFSWLLREQVFTVKRKLVYNSWVCFNQFLPKVQSFLEIYFAAGKLLPKLEVPSPGLSPFLHMDFYFFLLRQAEELSTILQDLLLQLYWHFMVLNIEEPNLLTNVSKANDKSFVLLAVYICPDVNYRNGGELIHVNKQTIFEIIVSALLLYMIMNKNYYVFNQMNPNNTDQSLSDIFPIQHKQTTTEIQSQSYFDLFNNYVSGIQSYKHLLQEQDLIFLKANLHLIKQHRFIFYQEYGSILVFNKKKQAFVPPNLGLLFFKELDMGAFTNQNQIIQYVAKPKGFHYYEIEQINQPFIISLKTLRNSISQRFSKLNKNQTAQKSPSVLKKIIELAIQKILNPLAEQDIQVGFSNNNNFGQSNPFDNNQVGLRIDIVKQGSINFNNIHFPQIKHEFCFLIYSFILGNPKLARLLLLSFKLKQLYSHLQKQKTSEILILRQCLNHLIVQYKALYNQSVVHHKDNALSIFSLINKAILNKYQSGQIKKQVSSTKDIIRESLRQQKQYERAQSIKQIVNYISFNSTNLGQENHIGFTIGLNISEQTPFTWLNEYYNLLKNVQNGQYYWICLVQKCFFGLASQLQELNKISVEQILLHMRQSKCILHEVVCSYQTIMTSVDRNKEYSLKVKNQAYSHVYLIKYLAAAISFQICTRNLNIDFDLSEYTIELDMEKLYSNFTSLSFQARQALQHLVDYIYSNQDKPVIFSLDSNPDNIHLKELAKVYSQFPKEKEYLSKQKKWIEEQVKRLQASYLEYQKRYKNQQAIIVNLNNQLCSCEKQQPSNIFRFRPSIKCERCSNLQKRQNRLAQMQRQTFELITALIPRAEKDQQLFAFFQNIKPVIGGTLKIIYQSQVPIVKKQSFSKTQSSCLNSLHPLYPYSPIKKPKPKRYSDFLGKFKASDHVVYQDRILIYYYDYCQSQPIDCSFLLPQIRQQYQLMGWMIERSDTSNTIREHKIYANMDKKGGAKLKEFNQMTMEQFKEYASIRVCYRTELIILAQGILSRHIAPSTLKIHEFERLIILNACGNISSFKMYERTQNTEHSEDYQQYEQEQEENNFGAIQQMPLPIIRESIQHLLNHYLQSWKFQDLYSLQIIGLVLSLLSMLIGEPNLAVKIAKRAFEQYQVIKLENANKTRVELRLRELYILHSIMSCFSQDICKNSLEGCMIFAKVMVNYRLNKRFLNSVHNGKKEYAAIVKQYRNYFQNAVLHNIDSVIKAFENNPEALTEVVKQVDKDIIKKCEWRFLNNLHYVFQGTSADNKYKINLFQGIILKNGAQTSQLPQIIKTNKSYIQIFGKHADLQVFKQRNGSIRTRSDFAKHFPQETDTQVFFEFCIQNQSSVKIRMIFKKDDQESIFLYVPHALLENQTIYIPQLYLKHYQCWIDQQKHHLIFRKRTLQTMNKIGLILLHRMAFSQLLDAEESHLNISQVDQGRIITKQFEHEPLSYLIQQEHQEYFQQLVITDKQHWRNKSIQILSSIQDQPYILQTYSSGQRKKTIFWLHRCDLKFTFDQRNGLVSQNFQGYCVSQDYNYHELLPWRRKDKIMCLMLRKHQHTFRSAILHQFILLLPNQNIEKGGKIKIIAGQTTPNNILNYEIHDSFMDIRSKSRLNQLHIICLIASLNSGLPFKPLMLTHEQYCISLIRSCYSNNQLDTLQCAKVLNLLSLCVQMNLNILTLCCDVLNKLSGSLRDILAYKQEQQAYDEKVVPYFKLKQNLIKTCKMIYRRRFEEGLISNNSKLNKIQTYMLGIPQKYFQSIKKQESLSKWFIEQSFSPQFQEKVVKGFQTTFQLFHKCQKDIEHVKETIMNFFDKGKYDNPEKDYILHIKLNDILAKQMLEDMKSSCQSYLRYSEKYQQIQLIKAESIKNLIKFFSGPKLKCQKMKQNLTKYMSKIYSKAQEHLDIIIGYKTIIRAKSYTQILCNPELIEGQYPRIGKNHSDLIAKAIRQWILLTLEIQSLSRILLILGQKTIDKVALFRQLQSPRKQINQKNYWICFQAEMKIRIWLSQYDTYKHLRDSQSGSVSQLNMGQGKTQVIIPMIVLDNLYDKPRGSPLTRINILSQLFQQAQANYFKFFSATSFRIPIFSLYFSRDVELTQPNINKIKFTIHLMRQKLLVLLDRESCLSMVLKIRQEYLKGEGNIEDIGQFRDQWLFDQNVYDIFDEVDAIMTCKKSFVYSIGASTELIDSRLRFNYARIMLQIVCVELFQWLLKTNMAIIQETYQNALQSIRNGGFPKGFRLKKNLSSDQLIQFRFKLVTILLDKYHPPQFQFYQNLTQKSKKVLFKFLTDQADNNIKQIEKELPTDTNQILAVRGLVAFRILEHCLTMRNGVDFGVPGEQHPKHVGVPYEAADVPSKRSQFSHPDVSIIVSYLSYFAKGITFEQFNQSLTLLTQRSQSASCQNYKLWMDIIKNEDFKPKEVAEFQQVNIDSQVQIEQLYEKFKLNRNTIVFWLVNCIFEEQLRQYASSITSSCWDISYVNKSIGFSGTKDTRWLFPNYLKWSPSQNDAINGTDGKMVHQMLRSTKGILMIKQGEQSLWQRFCQNVLDLYDQEVGCIIDAGAILVGKSFQKEIVPWIVKNPSFNKRKFKGITFCDQNGKWKVFDTITLSVVQRGTSIPEHDTFVIFDEARTRGADIKMGTNVRAVVTLSSTMTKDKLMQAVGRLRKFGRNQEIYIMATNQVFERIQGLSEQMPLRKKIQRIIEWAYENSINQNRNMQYPNSKLAQVHYKTILERQPDVQKFDTSLKSLYSGIITEKTVFEVFRQSISLKFSQKQIKTKQIKELSNQIKAYGDEHKMKSYDFEDICERQVEFVVETEKILQNQYDQLTPVQENNVIQVHNQKVSKINFRFDDKLKFSQNFINCTKSKIGLIGIFGNSSKVDNELSNVNFFLWQNGKMIIITQRQMTLQLSKGTANYGFYSLSRRQKFEPRFVGRFRDLSKQLAFIQDNHLEKALVHCQFFNGKEYFQYESRKILVALFKDYLKNRKTQPNKVENTVFSSNSFLNSSLSSSASNVPVNMFVNPQRTNNFGQANVFNNSKKPVQIEPVLSIEQIVSHFLKRRRTFQSKITNSDLQLVITQLKNVSELQLQ